jgi:hypothetical protein
MAKDENQKKDGFDKFREIIKAEELRLVEEFKTAELKGELGGAQLALSSLIASLKGRGIDTTGLDASGGGGVDVASLTAMVNDVGAKKMAAEGKEAQADLVAALGLLVPTPFNKATERENSTGIFSV